MGERANEWMSERTFFFNFQKCGTHGEMNDIDGKTEGLEEKPVPVPLYPPQIMGACKVVVMTTTARTQTSACLDKNAMKNYIRTRSSGNNI
jgi:hypothetical protein